MIADSETSQPSTNASLESLSYTKQDFETFTCFQRLPLEIRLKVWKCACFHTRDVHLAVNIIAFDIRPRIPNRQDAGLSPVPWYVSRTSRPPLLHANRESRFESLKWYKLDLGTSSHTPLMNFSIAPTIYVNWIVDRLCIEQEERYSQPYVSGEKQVVDILLNRQARSIALNLCDSRSDFIFNKLIRAKHVKEILLVFDPRLFCPDGDYSAAQEPLSYSRQDKWKAIKEYLQAKWPKIKLPEQSSHWPSHSYAAITRPQHLEGGPVLRFSELWHNDCESTTTEGDKPELVSRRRSKRKKRV